VDILCDSIIGDFNLDSNGGNGHEGQDGGDGFIGRSSLDQVRSVCSISLYNFNLVFPLFMIFLIRKINK